MPITDVLSNILCSFFCMCRCAYYGAFMEVMDSLWELFPSFYHVGPGESTLSGDSSSCGILLIPTPGFMCVLGV